MSSSTLDCEAHARRGTPCASASVAATTCAAVVGSLCGRVYYLKVDIEGFDRVCIDALERVDRGHRPLFVSAEDQSALDGLERLGYAGFKLVPHLMWSVADSEHLPEAALGWTRSKNAGDYKAATRTAKWRTAGSLRSDFRFGKAARAVGDQNDLYACRADVCGTTVESGLDYETST